MLGWKLAKFCFIIFQIHRLKDRPEEFFIHDRILEEFRTTREVDQRLRQRSNMPMEILRDSIRAVNMLRAPKELSLARYDHCCNSFISAISLFVRNHLPEGKINEPRSGKSKGKWEVCLIVNSKQTRWKFQWSDLSFFLVWMIPLR